MRLVLKRIGYLILVFGGGGFLIYLALPAPGFPNPPPGAVQSLEEADVETELKRAYFTNYTREQVVAHYENQFRFRVGTLRLNYPPEEAQTLIRDQARSVYLEELVHPFRESLYINGFVPSQAKDDIWYKGEHYVQKITIRYVPSSLGIRTLFGLLTLGLMGWMIHEYV